LRYNNWLNEVEFVSHPKARSDEEESKDSDPHQNDVDLKPSGEVTIAPKESPPTSPGTRRIHPRRMLPPVPEAPPE
jgi:hypothetical protein